MIRIMDTDDPFDAITRRFVVFEVFEDEVELRIGIQNLTKSKMVGRVLGLDAIKQRRTHVPGSFSKRD